MRVIDFRVVFRRISQNPKITNLQCHFLYEIMENKRFIVGFIEVH